MTALHWLLGWYIVVSVAGGAILSGAMIYEDISEWHGH